METFTLTLPDLETILTKGSCGCHFINPNKTRIILWRGEDPDTYYLRIGVQKFISYPLKDKNKARYWKFNPYELKGLEIQKELKNPAITKFQQRQAKANYGKSNSEPSVDNAPAP